jgi:hypothetical protein
MVTPDKTRRLRLVRPEDSQESVPPAQSPVDARTMERMIVLAKNILDDAETEWESDHASVELRDKFHLLRFYIDYLRQYCEGNS